MPFSELKCMENINTSCQKVNVYSHCTFYMIALFSFSRLAEKKILYYMWLYIISSWGKSYYAATDDPP